MKIGDLVRHVENGHDMDIGIIMEAFLDMYKVLWPDGSVLPHYPYNLVVIHEATGMMATYLGYSKERSKNVLDFLSQQVILLTSTNGDNNERR